jgi:ABC-type polysaccharide/polyol phosphate transport system ATPase subunit
MNEPIIQIENMSKSFIVHHRNYGLKSTVLHFPQYLRDIRRPHKFQALHQINLEIARGETVGIVGHNGSGKTSLLSLIGNVIRPSTGKITVRGRVSMMLSLGAGFCQELSGRENIMLNGVLQGISKRQMNKLMDDIIDFAGIGEFIDSPIYQYSSGMLARLGFGIVTAIEPEILLVDEVMAVGDVDFINKCEARMRKLLQKGTTLLLVSHNMDEIHKYCARTIEINHGRIVRDGNTSAILENTI